MMNTTVTQEEINAGVKDEFGVVYSTDGKRLLEGSFELKKYTVKDGTVVICDDAFNGCHNLEIITLPASLTTIGENAFDGCVCLVEVVMPDSSCLAEIGSQAFHECTALNSIVLPSKLARIEGNVFAESGLTEVENNSTNFVVENGVLYDINKTHVICCIDQYITEVDFPDTVEAVDAEAFFLALSLETVYFSKNSGLKTLGKSSFYCCESLYDINLPSALVEIGESAFCSCGSLPVITVPEGVKNIGERAFDICMNLESVTLPESLESVGDGVFDNCDSLGSIVVPEGSAAKFQNLLPEEYVDIISEE